MLNIITLVGRMVRDPECHYTNSGKPVSDITLAVPENKEITNFIDIKIWNRMAETLCEYVRKGDLIGVKGRLKHETYTNSNGEKRSKCYVLAEKVTFLSTKIKKDENNKIENTEQKTINLYPEEDEMPW